MIRSRAFRRRRKRRPSRQGAAMVAALLCLLVVSMIVGAMLSSLSLEVRGTRIRQRQLQATWLARSAIERAAARLQTDPTFTGETWMVSAADLGYAEGNHQAKVVIEVTREEESDEHRITVDASFPAAAQRQARCVRTVVAGRTQNQSEE